MPLLLTGLVLGPEAPREAAGKAASAPRDDAPNVVLIVVDDLNTEIGCYGSELVRTPNLDRLAARGLRFERAYCNSPKCNASRTAFLSGLHPEASGVLLNRDDPREALPDAVFLPEHFARHGYHTMAVGKIAHHWFPEAVRFHEVADPGESFQRHRRRWHRDLPFPWLETNRADELELDGMVAREAVRFLEAAPREPFFLAVGFHRPHTPHQAPAPYFELYPRERVPLLDRGGGEGLPPLAGEHHHPELALEERRAITANYAAAVTFMDAQLGLVLDALEELELASSTLVLLWSDHGWHLGDHGGLWGKGTLLEGSVRAPLLLAGPGIPTGTHRGVVETVDLYPTLAELCALPVPEGLQGVSLASRLGSSETGGERSAYTVLPREQGLARSVRTERYLYAEYPDGARQLYDLEADPHELHDLAGQPAHAETQRELAALLRRRAEAAARRPAR